MLAKCGMLVLGLGVLAGPAVAAEVWTERPDWSSFFSSQGVPGTIVVVDERTSSHWVFDKARAAARYLPASTFKIPHALFALDAGVVKDEFQVFSWDGDRRPIEAWNRDQNLRSSMRHSVVWVYQLFARGIGIARVEPQVGWWVGWVEVPEGPVFFALNIDLPSQGADTPKREAVVRAVLRSIGALPAE